MASRPHVLVADGDRDLGPLFVRVLRREGYAVRLATTLAEARKHLEAFRTDALLVARGFLEEGAAELLGAGTGPRAIVVLGERGDTATAVDGLPEAVVLRKPVRPALLVDVVRARLSLATP
jgi:DNA-binding response OmpR family regulator